MQSETSIMLGGESLAVLFLDGSQDTVFVRQLPIREYQDYLRLIDDEAATLELVCQKPAGWSDTLTPQSHSDLMEKAQALNLPFFSPWLRRRAARLEALNPFFAGELAKTVASRLAGSSPGSAPASVTPPAQPLN